MAYWRRNSGDRYGAHESWWRLCEQNEGGSISWEDSFGGKEEEQISSIEIKEERNNEQTLWG